MISGYFLFVLLLNLTFYKSKNNSVASTHFYVFFAINTQQSLSLIVHVKCLSVWKRFSVRLDVFFLPNYCWSRKRLCLCIVYIYLGLIFYVILRLLAMSLLKLHLVNRKWSKRDSFDLLCLNVDFYNLIVKILIPLCSANQKKAWGRRVKTLRTYNFLS